MRQSKKPLPGGLAPDVLRVAADKRRRWLNRFKVTKDPHALEAARAWEQIVLRFGGRHDPSQLSNEEFAEIARRRFGPKWKEAVAEECSRSLNTVHCYASGRRGIPYCVTQRVWKWHMEPPAEFQEQANSNA